MATAIKVDLPTALAARHGTMKLATFEAAPDYSALRYDYEQVATEHRQQVQDAAVAIKASADRLRDSIFVIGKRLVEVKDYLPHGEFGAWLRVEFDLSERMAQNMMNVAREYGGKSETVSVLSDSVLYLLAAPSTPPQVRAAVEAEMQQSGKSPSRAQVKRLRDEARQPEPAPARVVYGEPRPEDTRESEPETAIEPVRMESRRLEMAGFAMEKVNSRYRYVWRRQDQGKIEYSETFAYAADVYDAAFARLRECGLDDRFASEVAAPLPTAVEDPDGRGALGMFAPEWVIDVLADADPYHPDFKTALDVATMDDVRAALASLSTEEKHHTARLEKLQARFDELAKAAKPQPALPALPDDLASAGFTFIQPAPGQWAILREEGPVPFESNWSDDPAACIEEARAAVAEMAFGDFEAWLAAAPYEPDTRQIAAILDYAKRMAQRARILEPSAKLHVDNVVPPMSQLINLLEKKAKHG